MPGAELRISLATRWEEFWPEAEPLFELHQQELDEANGLCLDESRARELFETGHVVIALAHYSNVLIGYAIFYLTPALDRRGIVVAEQGPFFVAPEFRTSQAGLRLWRKSLEELRRIGVSEAMVHLLEKSPKGLRRLYEREGGKPWAQVWRIEL